MKVLKYHGCGNDFVLFEDYEGAYGPGGALAAEWVASMCDRRTGVGADGLIRITGSSVDAGLGMDYYNADGETAEMCGNGIRCLAVIAKQAGLLPDGGARVATLSGVKTVWMAPDNQIRVDMGPANSVEAATISVGATTVAGTTVDMGNPHFVMFGEFTDHDVAALGPAIETHENFLNRTNVEFASVRGNDIVLRVWERGVGETLACGTGACAAAVAAVRHGFVTSPVTVKLLGGELVVAVGETVWMTGPATKVFEADISTEPQTR